ncbi:hypothetical protein EOM60_04630 [Candidatus Saccharibacteria bacterium]|nr:hypothetical protein [Candidatus Saccharibacteria bacterium]
MGQVGIDLSEKNLRIGKGALWVINALGSVEIGDDFSKKKTWDDISYNTQISSTSLIGDQLTRIGAGLGETAFKKKIYAIGSPADQVVDVLAAKDDLQENDGVEIAIRMVDAVPRSKNHAGSSWEREYKEAGYDKAINEILTEVLPRKKAPNFGVMKQRAE